ncbi:MAG: dTMP kinase [Candidatus Iainarchaeum sp.]|jgi:dTMP kinase
MSRGKLIVIEGGDASGKSTQLKLLVNKLEEEGNEVVNMHFPKHDVSFGKVVDAYLRGEYGDKKSIPPEFVAMLYMTDFYESKDLMNKLLDEGKTIVLSRFFTSTLTYQTALASKNEKDSLREWIFDCCKRLPQPDLVLVLYVPAVVAKNYLENANRAESYKRGAKKDQHESDFEFQKNYMSEFDFAIKEFGWKKIDCVRGGKLKSIAEIHSLVFSEVKKIL